ncbi:MAG: hypothetical protein WC314_26875 [Vulcanimicrobiota bacterium]
MKTKRPKISVVRILGLLICLASFWLLMNLGADGYVTDSERKVARDQVRTLFKDLRPGMSHEEVRVLASDLDRLTLPTTNTEFWRIPTRPASLLSIEWVVSMEFDDEGRLVGAIVGTYDNAATPPPHPSPAEIGNFTIY